MSQTDEHGGDVPVKSGTSTRYPALGCLHCPAAFFSHEGRASHLTEKHSDKPLPESWESSEGHRVDYIPNLTKHHPQDRKSTRLNSSH